MCPQGDSTLNGGVFDVYNTAGTRVATLNTGSTNSATSPPLALGTYYVVERTPPAGYLLDTTRHRVVLTYFAPTVAIGNIGQEVRNQVIRGRIALVKFTDPDVQGNSQIHPPLEGAIFEIYLTSAGSFENARATERARITTDSNGFAETPLLPFGRYTVREVYAPGDVRFVDPFQVNINQDSQIHRFILNNPAFTSLVRIRKVDATTGQTIPAAGTSFKVWDVANDRWVRQRFNYPMPTTIDVFHTAEDGTLVMPEPLQSGDFRLYEVTAPYGYVLSEEPVPFTIHSDVVDPDNPEIIEVVFANEPQMGVISVNKRGRLLTGIENGELIIDNEKRKIFTPVFGKRGLENATFNIVAAENIVTPDGTVRAEKGEVVDTITTDENAGPSGAGLAESIPLFLGNYYLVEVEAPYGFVLDTTPYPVSLVYAGQEVAITSTLIGIANERQRAEILLQKVMEMPSFSGDLLSMPDGFNPLEDVRFGLFARQDILCVDGEVIITAGSLIEVFGVDNDGRGIIKTELPFGLFFIRELATTEGYILDQNDYDFVFSYIGQDTAVVEIAVNDGEVIMNYLIPLPEAEPELPTPEPGPEKPEPEPTEPEIPTSPQTGDAGIPRAAKAALALSGGLLVAMCIRLKRKNKLNGGNYH